MTVQTFQLGPLLIGTCEVSDEKESEADLQSRLPQAEIDLSRKFKHTLRRREFLAGRKLLHFLEADLPPLLSSDSGMPIWDSAYTGSISHKKGWVLACLESKKRFRGIGIDIEDPTSFPLGVSDLICRPDELKTHEGVFENQAECLAHIFSCKESLFKACYPLCHIWFGFQDAQLLSFEKSSGRFAIQLCTDLLPEFKSGQIFHGFFKKKLLGAQTFVITALALDILQAN